MSPEQGCRTRCALRSRLQHGFTLLELLVGLTLFSLIVAMLYGGFRLGTRSWESGASEVDSSSELRLASDFLRRQLSKTYPLAANDDGTWRMWFEGSPDRMVFLVDMAPRLGQGGLYEMTVSIGGVENQALTVARRPLREWPGDVVDDRHARPRSLIDDVAAAEFAYFGAIEKDTEPSWHGSWDDPGQLPMLIRIRVATRSEGQWPDLIVSVKADGIRYLRNPTQESGRERRGIRIPRGRG